MVLGTHITSTPVPTATTPTTLPANVYEVSTDPSVYHMTFSQSIWLPNDDSGLYNVSVFDNMAYDPGPYIGGRKKVMTNSTEMCGFVNIPNGWRATKTFVDIHSSHVDTLYEPFDANYAIYEVTTWCPNSVDPIVGATDGPKTLGGHASAALANTLVELDETMVGAIDNAMWIWLETNATWKMVAGGYVVIEEV